MPHPKQNGTQMMKRILIAAAVLASFAGPAIAQTNPPQSQDPGAPRTPLPQDRGYDKPSPRTDAINAPNEPARAAANAQVAAQSGAPAQPTLSAEAQAQYASDREAYRASLRQHNRDITANESFYSERELAYADAMRAWRAQAAACHHGSQAACNAPSPDPADYMNLPH
jgi:Ni/Co efflux regulator RcnB